MLDSEIVIFKKKLKMLSGFKGKGTELISLYVPPNTDRSNVMNQLSDEMSQSSNIKSPQTRKNVQGALKRLSNFLKQINFKIPETGIVIFSGNISEREGVSDIKLFTVRPPQKLKVKLYWCDSEFHLAPLNEMATPTDTYALITMDKREATIALLIGKKYEIMAHYTSGVPGKTRAGGQCLTPETLIQLSNGEIIEIKETNNPLQVKSANFKNMKIKDSKITDKWIVKKNKTVKLVTQYPKIELDCSHDHTLLTWKNNKAMEKTASALKKGDILLMPEKIKINGKKQALENNFFNSYSISKQGIQLIKRKREEIGLWQKQFAKKMGKTQTAISGIELGKRKLRLNFLKDVCKKLGIDFDWFIKTQCKEVRETTLPSTLNIELAQIVGYLLGDGNIEKERINFYERDKETIECYAKKTRKIFNANQRTRFRDNKKYYELRVQGRPIVRFLKENFPEIKKATNSSVPAKIMKSKNEVIGGFLRGIFDAEGYATKRGLSIGMNNKKLIQQIKLLLLRFGIICSIHEYYNRRNPYSKKHRFTIDITEKESLENFEKNIDFSFSKKKKKLKELIKSTTKKSSNRQLLISGSKIREIFEKEGLNTERFPKVTNFFRNERKMGKSTFQESIIKQVKNNKKLHKKFKQIHEYELLPVELKSKKIISKSQKMVDISIKNQNFIANGLIVHNSSQRFERLREEAAQDFYKRISEKVNQLLVNEKNLKGIVIGGPGGTKHHFIEKDILDYRLKEKILGTVDITYTDESGIREMIQKSTEILKESEAIQEKQLVSDFLTEIAKKGLAVFGDKETEKALTYGKVKTLLISEGIEWQVIKIKCTHCEKEKEIIIKNPLNFNANTTKCDECASPIEVIEEIDYLDYMLEKVQKIGAEMKIISRETEEGDQFYQGFAGIGALLRYK